jgi:peptidoglycan/xylan/chitin deacetylase (PgdA/CDA1 family)
MRGDDRDVGRRGAPAGTIRFSYMSIPRLSRAITLTLVAYCSACSVLAEKREVARVAPVAPEPGRLPPPVDATVLDPSSFSGNLTPAPFNPGADADLAGILAEGAVSSGEIALTFDDGPGAETTSEVLRILAAHRVKGAFFLTGERLAGSGVVPEMNRGIARAIAAAGHTIGNHGLDHVSVHGRDASWITFQIEESARLIGAASGVPVRYFRPPYGKIGPFAQSLLAQRRDELVMWTIDAQDTRERDPEKLAARLIAQIAYAGQGVVLLHDLRGPSVRALALLLDWLESHPRDDERGIGYRIVDLPTYLAHAAARPWPYRTRLELYHVREKLHGRSRTEPSVVAEPAKPSIQPITKASPKSFRKELTKPVAKTSNTPSRKSAVRGAVRVTLSRK